ncbi:LysR family transcriptional regulator [Pelagicoccus sp. SDUM812005]|uniref:LysR family transcriptional regulator n=1 Tax=Pelagicoccus sp. SDUM812005 TaxID=3041257 RepID=UPI00280CAC2B|nr:LysR family transcriptional regulator [Pelagicoccus sp. SDUM812005]MDQ8183280.1 LysR family transcriptional regulator [Pelagicoccus sp. SDUM812005]
MREDIIDSRQLLAFKTLAETGSFTLAAKQLNLTQSAVSHSIKALEDDLGCPLINRLGRKIHLTEAGDIFLAAADRIHQRMQSVRGELEALSRWGAGRLRIGAGTTACQYILPTVIREFRQTFPDCQLSISPNNAKELMDELRGNEIDLALTLSPQTSDDIDSQSVFEDNLQFAVAPSHPWASRKVAPPSEIDEQTFVTYSKGSMTFESIRRHFRAEGHSFNKVIELGSMEAIKELVKIGIGVGIIAPWVAQKEIADGSIHLLAPSRKQLKRTWGVCYLKGRRLSLMEETFIGLCESVCDCLEQ